MKYSSEKKHIGMLIKCIEKKIVNELNKELEQFDITLMQNEVLRYIYFHEKNQDVFQKQIEEFFNSTNPTITGILNRLEGKELIKREINLKDARYKKLTVTPKGKELLDKMLELGPKKVENKLTQRLSVEERDELERLLILVLDGLEN
ncbi:MAG: MarR family transcriptional regulator [Candidatus Cellulosilyticum pullistercoris]|uniref:MarR family transcriptional regulator n=1 Tax=Candidatus Cellulosilyticum pullistercoris TaxID=2838521 RepID=A0A9E2KCS7_9FIRM|nr:MarR family transcriptional regulator [Candidatus Cellulosilyticum pullistercoris]